MRIPLLLATLLTAAGPASANDATVLAQVARPSVVTAAPAAGAPSTGPVQAGVRTDIQAVRQPRIQSLASPPGPRQFFMPENLEIRFSGLGAPGQVQVSLHPFTTLPPGSPPDLPGAAALTGCYFTGNDLTVPAIINPDGTAIARVNGYWLPKSRFDVGRDGYCRFEVRIQRLQADLRYREEARLASAVIRIAPHESVNVTSTARLRAFLKPVSSSRCVADDAGDKFGIRITAAPAPQSCRTDFLKPSGSTQYDIVGNALGHGAVLTAMQWKLEGDTSRCELCDNPLSPCRGITPQAMFAETLGADTLEWVYAPVRAGEIGNGHRYAVLTGPPNTRSGALIRIDTNGYDYGYDPSTIDYLNRLFAVAGGSEPPVERAVIARADALWRSWMRPFGIGMACSAWAPPPASTTKSALGQLSQGQLPSAPPAPHLRLVLDSVYVLRPVGQRLPWE